VAKTFGPAQLETRLPTDKSTESPDLSCGLVAKTGSTRSARPGVVVVLSRHTQRHPLYELDSLTHKILLIVADLPGSLGAKTRRLWFGRNPSKGISTAMTPESIDLKNKVVAIFETEEAASQASSAVSNLGKNVILLEGEEGRARLPQNQGGIKGALKTAAMTFGDEIRVLDGLDEALARGDQVLVVETGDGEADRVVTTLDQNQGRFVWSFGEWTFKPAAPEADEEDTA
jgi:hypothetical protein